jgi:hypothetical protein
MVNIPAECHIPQNIPQYFQNVKIQVRHKSVNQKCITVYCGFNGFYKVIVQSDLHCYLDI